MDVLAANPLATALVPWYVTGENLVRAAFLDPRVRDITAELGATSPRAPSPGCGR